MKCLNLGCGLRYHPDWVNIDGKSSHPSVLEWDLRKGIPHAGNGFQVVCHSHVLEHFTRRDALGFLEECRRVLAPHGVIRIAVPDLEGIVRTYLESLEMALRGDEEGRRNHEWMMLELYDQAMRQHAGGLMMEYLKALLGREACGMLSVARFRSSGEIHQWMYDRYSLKMLLEKAGFRNPKRVGPRESRIADWASYHLDTDADGSVYKPDSPYMEAVKP